MNRIYIELTDKQMEKLFNQIKGINSHKKFFKYLPIMKKKIKQIMVKNNIKEMEV